MLEQSKAFSGFSVSDLDAARAFYGDTLGLTVEDGGPGFTLKLAGGTDVLVYPSPGHQPASYTILNFPVSDIEAAVDDLAARGVVFETYAGTPMATDAKGVFRQGGPLIAWFKDPAGNTLSVLEVDR
jgi:catechol 2,3-dioxygenase-like lactoylglutathione lyase family enzyme